MFVRNPELNLLLWLIIWYLNIIGIPQKRMSKLVAGSGICINAEHTDIVISAVEPIPLSFNTTVCTGDGQNVPVSFSLLRRGTQVVMTWPEFTIQLLSSSFLSTTDSIPDGYKINTTMEGGVYSAIIYTDNTSNITTGSTVLVGLDLICFYNIFSPSGTYPAGHSITIRRGSVSYDAI